RPGIVGNDCDAAQWLEARRNRGRRNLHDALDAGDRQRFFGVVGFDLAAIDPASLDRGVFHARNDDVDAISFPAAGDVLDVDDRARFADIAPVLPVFWPPLVRWRDWHRRGKLGEVAIGKLAAAARMHDETILRLAFGDRDIPGLG